MMQEMHDTAAVPPWLIEPPGQGRRFGTITLLPPGDKYGWRWRITAEPQVCQMAKRLFAGCDGRTQGEAVFSAADRQIGDLTWLMLRWPLEIAPEARDQFEAMRRRAIEHERKQAEWATAPKKEPTPQSFRGSLMPFQQEGLAWCRVQRRTLLADEMGLGKTPQALALLAAEGTWPALIVAPAHLLSHWRRKIGEFLGLSEVMFGTRISDGVTVEQLRGFGRGRTLPQADIWLVHYGVLHDWAERLEAAAPRIVVFDEVQELRHRANTKHPAAMRLSERAEMVIGLSGTPIYGQGEEIHNVLSAISPGCLGDYDGFQREWCGYGGRVVRPDLLGRHLKEQGLILRRVKEDVLSDLPAKRRAVEVIDADQGLFREAIEAAKRSARAALAATQAMEKGRLMMEAVNSARAATGIAKADAAATFIAALIEAGEAPIVFAYHHAVINALCAGLTQYRPVTITGALTAAEKDVARQAFIDGNAGVVIINLRAATGLDGLQHRARCVVFAELDWSPAVHAQAEDRAYRIGQRDSVMAYYLVSEDPDGTDQSMMASLSLKVEQSRGLMLDRAETEEDEALAGKEIAQHMRGILARLAGQHPSAMDGMEAGNAA